MNMDRIDEHLIYLLQKNARMSLKDLAKEVYLSTPKSQTPEHSLFEVFYS